MILRTTLFMPKISRNLVLMLGVVALFDISTRLIVLSSDLKQPDLSLALLINDENALLTESQVTKIREILSQFKPAVIVKNNNENDGIIKYPSLSEQGGFQNEIFIDDLVLQLIAVFDEPNETTIFIREVDKDDNSVIKKYSLNDDVHGMTFRALTPTQINFEHPELSKNITLKVFENFK